MNTGVGNEIFLWNPFCGILRKMEVTRIHRNFNSSLLTIISIPLCSLHSVQTIVIIAKALDRISIL